MAKLSQARKALKAQQAAGAKKPRPAKKTTTPKTDEK